MIKNGKIVLLRNVVVDSNLLKFKKKVNTEGDNNSMEDSKGTISGWSFDSDNLSRDSFRATDTGLDYLDYLHNNAPTWQLSIKIWLYKKLYSRNLSIPVSDRRKKLTLDSLMLFFDSIKTNVSDIDKDNIVDVLSKYETTLDNAIYNNQIALVEKINGYIDVLRQELILSMSKFNKYLTEESIVKFHNVASAHEKYKTGLRLTYVKNFVKIIPEGITGLKKEADEFKIFDNYVILHYDYSGTSVEDTKAEKEKKKDPILFGVIQGSTNLYYIGDWIDDYCDLTLDVIIKKIGKSSLKTVTTKSIDENIKRI